MTVAAVVASVPRARAWLRPFCEQRLAPRHMSRRGTDHVGVRVNAVRYGTGDVRIAVGQPRDGRRLQMEVSR